MELITLQKINHFLDCKTMAIAGASRNEKSFSAQVAKHLTKLGYNLWFVNPGFEPNQTANQRVQSVSLLPEGIHLLVLTPQNQTESVMQQADDKGIKDVWIQQQSETIDAVNLGRKNKINLVSGQCIFMFSQPEGMHKFHHRIKKLFGSLPT